jgi:ligand-binding sensor domain-containing protein
MLAIKTIWLPGYLLFWLSTSIAVKAQNDIRLNFRHMSPKNGLSSIYVRKIVQDPYGYMWVGTQEGLNRYEGKNFIVYDKGGAARHALTGVDIRDLLVDSLHSVIWEINSYGGIDAIDYVTGNVVYAYSQNEYRSTTGIVFNSLAQRGDSLFIGSTGGLFVLTIRNRHLSKVVLAPAFAAGRSLPTGGKPDLVIDNITCDESGHLWLFCENQGVVVVDAQTLSVVDRDGGAALQLLYYDCSRLEDGRVLAATGAGLRAYALNADRKIVVNNDPFPLVALSKGKDIYSCRQDRKGYVWFCTAGYLVRMTASGKSYELVKEHMSRSEADWLDAVYNIRFDREDNVWLGCQAGLAYSRNEPSCFTSITRSSISEESITHAYSINPVNDNLLYCCTQQGLYIVDPGKGIITSLDNKRPYYYTLNDPFGRLIVSNIDGLFFFGGRRAVPLSRVYPEFRSLSKVVVNSHCYSGDSLIIFGTQNNRGIVVWNYRARTARFIDEHTPAIWLKESVVSDVYKDHRGNIWVLGDHSISLLDFGRRMIHPINTFDTLRRQFYSLFFDICQVADRYYLTSYGSGVLVLDSNYNFIRELSTKDGLSDNSVYKIIPYKDSLLFVTSNNGLSVVDVRDHYATTNYYESDGLHSDNFEEYSGAIHNGIIYAGGANGLTAIDPSLFGREGSGPGVYVRAVNIETPAGLTDTSNILLSSLDIPNDVLQTTVYFSAIHYSNPERCRLAYQIKELNSGWIDLGSQDRVTLIGLAPGSYTLLVRSANANGIWSDRPVALTLRYLPKWYQTFWFRLLVVVVLAGIFYGLYLYRIDQLKKQQRIRKDIASDLHDDLGSTLNSVKIFTHLAKREQGKEEYLTRIEESLTEASIGLRDMIWVLDDSEDTLRELMDRIRKFALPVAQANGIRFESVLEEDISDLVIAKGVKRGLLLIAKESVNNSFKYSACSLIRVSLRKRNDKLSLLIEDDGRGFDVGNFVAGNGLKNIRERARQIRFTATISSSPEGTVIAVVSGG